MVDCRRLPPTSGHCSKNRCCHRGGAFPQNTYGEEQFSAVFRAIIKNKSSIASALFEFVRPGPSDIAKFSASSNFAEIMAKHEETRKSSTSKPSVGDLTDGENAWY